LTLSSLVKWHGRILWDEEATSATSARDDPLLAAELSPWLAGIRVVRSAMVAG